MKSPGEAVILDRIPFELDVPKVIKHLRLHGDPRRFEKITGELLERVTPLARPKAVYRVSCVGSKSADSVEIDGVQFRGKLVRDLLINVETVFPCITTCGTELETIILPESQVMERFCLDAIKNLVLFEASAYARGQIQRRFGLGELSSLNPGELESFPSSEHRLVFRLLGDVEGMIGVHLSPNCALIPLKSGSSLLFSAESKFVSCRLCKMRRCQGRRAGFDPALAAQYPGRS